MRNEFIAAIEKYQPHFGISIPEEKIERLADYFDALMEDNPLLHLVAPCPPEEFATRHILESLTMLGYLPLNARFADIGSGGGLPAIPCLILRDDLKAILIESKAKKAAFLQKVLAKCKMESQAKIINKQFEEAPNSGFSYLSCRAIEKFSEKLPRIMKWAGNCNLLFFGGNNLREAMKKSGLRFSEKLLPLSEQRYLFYLANQRGQIK